MRRIFDPDFPSGDEYAAKGILPAGLLYLLIGQRIYPLYYKYVVKIARIIAVICIMKRQRRNDFLVEQVVERLKAVRRERGLTQENVRFDTDLNIGRIESGRHSISLTTLADLCDYYNIPLEEFFKQIVTH